MTARPKKPPQNDAPTFGDRVRYRIDLFMSRGPASRFIGLFVLAFLIVLGCGGLADLIAPSGNELKGDLPEAMWWALLRVADAGSMGEDKETWFRVIALLATLGGVMVVAVLIGLVSSTIGEKIEDLRRGKSPVIDSNHILILGFCEKVYPILRELREANANQKSATVVILSPFDKIEVEAQVRERLGDLRTTRVVVRQGSAFSPGDLRKVGAGRAKSIIVLSEAVDAEGTDPDMNAIKAVLALRRVSGALTKNHAVVEVVQSHRIPVIQRLGGKGVEVVAMRDTLARLMVQTARQSGLAGVYRELLRFEGSELYIKGFPELAGTRFGDVHQLLQRAVAMGIRRVDGDTGNIQVLVNPAPSLAILPGDELLVLAEDDDSFGVDPAGPMPTEMLSPPPFAGRGKSAERILVMGFRSDLEDLIAEFDNYASVGSELHLMAGDHDLAAMPVGKDLKKLTLKILAGDPTNPFDLTEIENGTYDSVLLVANDTLTPDEADARTVISLLMLRDLFEKKGPGQRPRIISEILDTRTKDLVSTDDSSDFVVSSEMTSMLLAQVAEQRELNLVFADLFSPDGSEIYLKSTDRYVASGRSVSWLTVQNVAKQFNEVAIGCYRPGVDPLLNPSQQAALCFRPGDKLIVIAEDDGETAFAGSISEAA